MSLIEVIKEDCKLWEQLTNKDKFVQEYMYLQVYSNSDTTGMYQLILNGFELWFGTLNEINAIVKSMCARLQYPERYEVA